MPDHLNGVFFYDDTSAYSAYHIIVCVAIYSKFEEETSEKRKNDKIKQRNKDILLFNGSPVTNIQKQLK